MQSLKAKIHCDIENIRENEYIHNTSHVLNRFQIYLRRTYKCFWRIYYSKPVKNTSCIVKIYSFSCMHFYIIIIIRSYNFTSLLEIMLSSSIIDVYIHNNNPCLYYQYQVKYYPRVYSPNKGIPATTRSRHVHDVLWKRPNASSPHANYAEYAE